MIFNAFTSRFVAVRNKILTSEDYDTNKIKTMYPTLYTQMYDAGMIVNDSVDEPSLLVVRIRTSEEASDEFILHINPTLDCNFDCWYCYENHVKGSKMSADTLESTKKLIDSIVGRPNIRSLNLGFFGGEPLYHFNSVAKPLITHAEGICASYGKKLHVHFTSNGALLNDKIISFLSQVPCGFQITLDGDRTRHDRTRFFKDGKGSFDIIVQNILKLADVGINVIVRVNYTKENIDGVNDLYENFKGLTSDKRRYLSFDFQRVWQDRNNRFDRTEVDIRSEREFFLKSGFAVRGSHIPNNVANPCYGDKTNYALLNYDGLVFGCTARDFTKEHCIGRLNNSGEIVYDKEKVSLRNSSKLSKDVCRKCRIAPLCGGGCKQRAYESLGHEGCSLGHTETEKDDIILDILEHHLINAGKTSPL